MKKILFKSEMVMAILAGHKTQTRRIHKPRKRKSLISLLYNRPVMEARFKAGEVIYVGETYRINDSVDPAEIMYAAGMIIPHYEHYRPWKSGMLMPEKYARIKLKITEAKKQKLKDMTQAEAIAEGFDRGCYNSPLSHFAAYFRRINPAADGNTEVWAYTFEVLK